MLATAPRWTATPKHGLTKWYGHVHLLERLVLGQWFAAKREDGSVLWEACHSRANTICDVSEEHGVIVASETRSDGPWTAGFGCYAIALDTGKLLWTNHGSASRKGLLRTLDFLPGYTNEFRDTARAIRDGKCVCESGRVLDLATGEPVGALPDAEVAALRAEPELTAAERLYREGEVDMPNFGLRLTNHTKEPNGGIRYARGAVHLSGIGHDGAAQWSFDIRTTGYCIDGNYYSYRLIAPFVYFVVSEDPQWKNHPRRPRTVLPNPAMYRVLTLDVRSGEIVQDHRISESEEESVRIEDADSNGLLISAHGKEIRHFDCITQS